MKLFLCCPSQLVKGPHFTTAPDVSVPLGILMIAAYVRASGWDGKIELYDSRLSGKLFERVSGDVTETILGDTDEEVRDRLRVSSPDVIGISNMYSSQFPQALRLADIAREICPAAKIVIGGPHASVFYDEVLAHPAIDYVVLGEGEQRLLALLQCLESGTIPAIQGVLGRPEDKALLLPKRNVKINFIEHIDDLPFPAYDMVEMERYFELNEAGVSARPFFLSAKRTIAVITSRGCPHQCVFCSIHPTVGYKWRSHSPAYVRRHLELLRDKYQVSAIHFEDDNLTHDTERYDRILDELMTFEPKFVWDAPNGVRGDSWTFERIKRSKDAGCAKLIVAIESGVQEVIDKVVKKRLDLRQVDKMMSYCGKVGLRLSAFYIIGMPGETLSQIRQTIRFALARFWRYGVNPIMGIAIPLPGTEMYDNVMQNHLYSGELKFQRNQIVTKEFNPEIIQAIFNDFLRKKKIVSVIRYFTSLRALSYRLKSFSRRMLRKVNQHRLLRWRTSSATVEVMTRN